MAALDRSAPVAVIGCGAMGQGIAQVAAQAGHPVLLLDSRPGAASTAVAGIAKALGSLVDKGKLAPDACDTAVARLTPVSGPADLGGAALVVEAIVEDLAVKQAVFKEVEAVVAPSAILASNTSSLPITAIAAALQRPERFAGMHFFNPAPLMALVEVIRGVATDPAVAGTLFDTAKAWGKAPVHARSTPGFIVNRVARPFYAEALRLLQEGAGSPATIDAVMRESGGFRMGPFELMDLIGHDVNFAVTCSVHRACFGDPRFQPSLVQQELVEAGRLGRKTGQGFYRYAPDPEVPEPHTAEPCPAPRSPSGLGPADVLSSGRLEVNGVTLALTDGRSATRRASEEGIADLVLYDLALDYSTASRVGLAAADQASPTALRTAVGFFQSLGKAVSVLDDAPGLVVMRTVAMLANEAADAVLHGVANPGDVDTAMTKGVNYPLGPLAWAERIGLGRVAAVLDALASTYGEDRYRTSALIRRKVWGGTHFYG